MTIPEPTDILSPIEIVTLLNHLRGYNENEQKCGGFIPVFCAEYDVLIKCAKVVLGMQRSKDAQT